MSEYDFKCALAAIDELGETAFIYECGSREIKVALRIADRLQRGEVSDEAQDAFDDEDIYRVEFYDDDYEIYNDPDDFKKAFHAMAKQIIKECSDE